MSLNPQVDEIVSLPIPDLEPEPGNGHTLERITLEAAPAAEPTGASVAQAKPARLRPAWVAPAAITAVGLFVAGSLGYLLYSTIQQRDGLQTQLVSTRASLATSRQQLAAAQADAAQKKVTADYVALYVADEGKVLTDYEATVACGGYSACRTSAQQFLSDLQAFQSDRKSANVPFAVENQDSSLGDALSAAIAGDQELISGMDNGDVAKIDAGSGKVDAAMLNVAKAEAAMGVALR